MGFLSLAKDIRVEKPKKGKKMLKLKTPESMLENKNPPKLQTVTTTTIKGKEVIITGTRKERRTSCKILNRAKSESKKCTIGQYLGIGHPDHPELVCDNVNANPVHQRPPVSNWNGTPEKPQYDMKMSGIIESIMFDGYSIGTLILHKEENDVNWLYESIDGGHRKRALKYFFEGSLVILHEGEALVWGALHPEEQDIFLNAEIDFLIYDGLNNFQKGDLFRTINESTYVNDQEQLNAYGDTDVANGIRGFVRGIGDYPKHQLFSAHRSGSYVLIQPTNLRLNIEKILTKICWVVLNNKFIAGTKENYSTMFAEMRFPKEKLTIFLNKLVSLAQARKSIGSKEGSKLSEREIRYFTFLHFYLGDYVIRDGDWDAFYDQFEQAIDRFYDKDDPIWGKVSENAGNTDGKFIDKLSSHWDSLEDMTKVAEAVISNFRNLVDVVVIKDPKRSATARDKETQFKKQGRVCEVERRLYEAGVAPEPQRIAMSRCECAHIDLHCKGSSSELGDFYMIKKEHHKEQTKRKFDNLDDFINTLISEKTKSVA